MTRPGEPLPWTRFAPPRASEALRERVLATSRPVAAACPVATRADRIWFSRGWRLAWVAVLLLLVTLDRVAVRPSAVGRGAPSDPPAMGHEADRVAMALGLPRGGWLGARVMSGSAPERDLILEPR